MSKIAVVVNSNVVYSSLLTAGYTREFLAKLFMLKNVDVYAPYQLRKEISTKLGRIAFRVARKRKMKVGLVLKLVRNLKAFIYSNIRFASVSKVNYELVIDPDDAPSLVWLQCWRIDMRRPFW